MSWWLAVYIYLCHYADSFHLFVRERSALLYSILDVTSLFLASVVRLFGPSLGHAKNLQACRRPQQPLEFYDLHGCPYCRRVRDVLHYLEIDHIVYPCPKESLKQQGVCINSRFRPKAKSIGGRCIFPLIVDPNKLVTTNTDSSDNGAALIMYESEEIMTYLWREYGDKAEASALWKFSHSEPVVTWMFRIVGLLRPCLDMGVFRAASRQPEKPLTLTGDEGNPFCVRVEETLATLEIPYYYYNYTHSDKMGRCLTSHFQCLRRIVSQPILKDANTGVELHNYKDAVAYLKKTYQTAPVPAEKWTDHLAVMRGA